MFIPTKELGLDWKCGRPEAGKEEMLLPVEATVSDCSGDKCLKREQLRHFCRDWGYTFGDGGEGRKGKSPGDQATSGTRRAGGARGWLDGSRECWI